MENHLIVIDGGNREEASSYFIVVDDVKILLDCGKSKVENLDKFNEYGVDIKNLDGVCISHFHFANMGGIEEISRITKEKCVYLSTIKTKALIRMIYSSIDSKIGTSKDFIKRLKLDRIFQKIEEKEFLKKRKIGGVKVSFIPAGHTLGAAMVYIEGKKDRILYTGDFSFQGFGEINRLTLKDINPNIIIMSSTNSSQKYKKINNYKKLEKRIKDILVKGKKINIYSKNVEKIIEGIIFLKSIKIETSIYLEEQTGGIAESLEKNGIDIFSKRIKRDDAYRESPHILLGGEEEFGYENINLDNYMLKAGYREFEDLIDLLNPKKIFLVGSKNHMEENLLEQFRDDGYEARRCLESKYYKL